MHVRLRIRWGEPLHAGHAIPDMVNVLARGYLGDRALLLPVEVACAEPGHLFQLTLQAGCEVVPLHQSTQTRTLVSISGCQTRQANGRLPVCMSHSSPAPACSCWPWHVPISEEGPGLCAMKSISRQWDSMGRTCRA